MGPAKIGVEWQQLGRQLSRRAENRSVGADGSMEFAPLHWKERAYRNRTSPRQTWELARWAAEHPGAAGSVRLPGYYPASTQ